jgi:hypothetical protein
MRFFLMGPRIFGIGPGISFGAEDFSSGRREQPDLPSRAEASAAWSSSG